MTEILRVLKNFALSFLAGDVIAARTLRMYAAIQLPGLYLNYAEDERRKRRADVLRSVLETRGAAQTQPVAFSAIIVYHTNADGCELAPSAHWTPDSNLRACHLLPERISCDERAALKSSCQPRKIIRRNCCRSLAATHVLGLHVGCRFLRDVRIN